MFQHPDNQSLLWQTLQKSPYLVEFSQKYSGHKDNWFRTLSEQLASQISRGDEPSDAASLLKLNKHVLQVMIADLKRLLGYNELNKPNITVANTIKDMSATRYDAPSVAATYHVAPSVATYNVAPAATYNVAPAATYHVAPAATYNVAPAATYQISIEKQEREDKWNAEFNSYQAEYNRLLSSPALPENVFSSGVADEKIKNMDELLAEQVKKRTLDYAACLPPPPAPSSQHSSVNMGSTRLKILDDIDRVEIEQEVLHKTGAVRWSEQLEEYAP